MTARRPGHDLLLIESGGDNLAATFSPDLVDAQICVIDVSEGDKITRKGGPGITKSDLLAFNEVDLAPWSTPTSASWNDRVPGPRCAVARRRLKL